jgi:hypothetical protein
MLPNADSTPLVIAAVVEVSRQVQRRVSNHTPGFVLADSVAQVVSWKGGRDLGAFAGQPNRLRFELKDADLFALQFVGKDSLP